MTNDNGTIPFKPRVTPKVTPSDPNTELVKMFEDYLAAAKAGKIKFAAVASVDERNVAYSTWEPHDTSPELITSSLGAVSYLFYRFNESANAGAEFDDSLRPDDQGPGRA